MLIPNYKQDNITNLMSSLLGAMNVKSKYSRLKSLNSNEISKKKNIVLIVVDGLGYDWLVHRGKTTFIHKNLKQKLTSVFPSTTATAIPLFMTGYPAQQHALTGWKVFLKEIGCIVQILKSNLRMGGPNISQFGVDLDKIYNFEVLQDKINRDYYVLTMKKLMDSDYNKITCLNSKNVMYEEDSITSFFRQMKKSLKNEGKKYIYAYWSKLDMINHEFGPNSHEALNHFIDFDRELEKFISTLDKNTTVLLTSDHGFVYTPHNKQIWVEDHPKLQECLSMTLTSESRLAFAYVKSSKKLDFEKYLKTKLTHACRIIKSEEAIDKNYFGLFKANPKLKNRVGDYMIIMKENYVLKDRLINSERTEKLGAHGGVSREEMFVPLVTFNL